ncbi:MAG TPA: hypothetical protein VFK45_02220, partial [Gammaproteobacteria bacterium]|nr:hypothetical protein [Gammaproteobacteria bacterium]
GNAQLWYIIADANGLDADGNAELTTGTELTLPAKAGSLNNAGTFQPYDAGQILGADTPSLPYVSPANQQCNVLATVVVIADSSPAIGASFGCFDGSTQIIALKQPVPSFKPKPP